MDDQKKDKKDNENVFDLIEGFRDVDPNDLKQFKEAMTKETIPAIVQIVEKRKLSAAESRHRQLKT